MEIKVQPNGVGSFYPLSTSPFNINCQVSTTDTTKTVITGLGWTSAMAGNVATFLVTLYDVGNNQKTIGGDSISVAISSASHPVISDIEILDNKDGTYRVSYLVSDASEVYTVKVIVNGDLANSQTSSVAVVANSPDPWHSTLTATTPVTIDLPVTYSLQVFDAFNNPV